MQQTNITNMTHIYGAFYDHIGFSLGFEENCYTANSEVSKR